ncbi:MAG TPA: hypothetical protein VK541_19270 [Pedobacter sp.]|nr:hypothetical protein [Pedobacter sp.]HMI04640.1 hypothetical protein [Pedobacter sp.]
MKTRNPKTHSYAKPGKSPATVKENLVFSRCIIGVWQVSAGVQTYK